MITDRDDHSYSVHWLNIKSLLHVNLVVYSHPLGEIWQTNAHPNRVDIVGTVHSKSTILFCYCILYYKLPMKYLQKIQTIK